MNNPLPRYNRRSVLRQGLIYSAGLLFSRFLPLQALAQSKTLEESASLSIDLVLGQPLGGRVEKPYIAVWLEDEKGNHVKTIALWVNKAELERTRWIPDLRRWFKMNETRKTAAKENLVATISSPTRVAGKYSLSWNCKNENKDLIAPGTYTLLIESAREHGRYQLIRETLVFGSENSSKTIKGDINVQDVKIEYRARK